jgi:GT2 family glycosyltransferase
LGERPFQLDWRSGPRMLYGVNYAFRRSVFSRLGGYDTTLGSRGEDQELFDRLAAANARVFYDPRIVVRHMISADRLTRGYYRDWYRATGLARARLPAPGRQVLGIPLYTLRQGAQTWLQLAGALLTFDRAAIFRNRLRCSYFFNFYRGCLKQRPALRQVKAMTPAGRE